MLLSFKLPFSAYLYTSFKYNTPRAYMLSNEEVNSLIMDRSGLPYVTYSIVVGWC